MAALGRLEGVLANMSDLRVNKILGAVLATGLVILGLRQVSDLVFATNPPAKAGYAVAVADTGAAGGAEVADVPPDWGTVLPTADAAAGQTTSTKCLSCHNFTNGGPNATGPNLWGVIGRKPGTHPGFAYSSGMTDFGGKTPVWDFDHLYMFLAGPQSYINGTKMTFVGLKKPEDRINLIAWLRTQSSSPVPIPAANPKAAAKGPAPAAGTTVPAATTGAPNAVAVPPGTPAQAQTSNPTGQTPSSGAAAAPGKVNESPGGTQN